MGRSFERKGSRNRLEGSKNMADSKNTSFKNDFKVIMTGENISCAS